MEELLKFFTVDAMTDIISQKKADQSFITDTFFKNEKPILSSHYELIIKKGSGVILESVNENGEHLVTKNPNETIISVPLPRFPQYDVLSASEMNLLKTLNTQNEQAKSLSVAIGEKLAKQKSNITNTIEYMAAGALFGKIMDGKGNVLFSLAANRKKITITNKTDLLFLLSQIEAAQISELGTPKPYIALITRELYAELLKLATEQELMKTGVAKVSKSDNGGLVLELFGQKFMPYDATYQNQKGKPTSYMSGKQGIVVPVSDDMFELVYCRANHTSAIGKAPSKFFAAAPEVLDKGVGWAIVSESRPLPICNRLDAIVELTFE